MKEDLGVTSASPPAPEAGVAATRLPTAILVLVWVFAMSAIALFAVALDQSIRAVVEDRPMV